MTSNSLADVSSPAAQEGEVVVLTATNRGVLTLHWFLKLGLAGVFIVAAFHKVIDPGSFAASVYRFDLLPDIFVQPVAIALPWLEVTAAVALLTTRSWRQAGTLLLLGLMVVFTTAAASAKWRGLNISCGCFSTQDPSPIGWWLFVRNAGLVLALLVLAWLDVRMAAQSGRKT